MLYNVDVLDAIIKINEVILKSKTKNELLDNICKILVQDAKFLICRVSTLDKNNNKFISLSYHTESKEALEYLKIESEKAYLDSNYTNSLTAKAYFDKKYYVIKDINQNETYEEHAKKLGYNSKGAFPIIYKNNIYGILTLYSEKKDYFDNNSIKIINHIVDSIAFAIYKLELEKEESLLIETLEKTEEKFNLILENTKQGLWEYDIQEDALIFSKQCYKIIDSLDPTTNIHTGSDFLKLIHDDDIYDYKKTLVRYYKHKIPTFEATIRIKTKDNNYKWVLMRGKCIEQDDNSKCLRLSGVVADITDIVNVNERLQKLNNFYRTISETSQLIVKSTDRQDLENKLCKIAARYNALSLVWYGIINEKTNHLTIKTSYSVSKEGEEYIKSLTTDAFHKSLEKDLINTVCKNRTPVIIQDIMGNISDETWKNNVKKANIASIAVFPIAYKEILFGIFTLYTNKQSYFDDEIVDLLSEMSQDIGFAFHKIDLENSIKQAEDIWKTALDIANEIIVIIDFNENRAFISSKFYELLGYEKGPLSVSDDDFFNLLCDEDKPFIGTHKAAIKSGQIDSFSGECRLRCKNKTFKWFYHRVKLIERNDDGTGKLALATFLDIDDLKNHQFKLEKITNIYKVLSKTNQLIVKENNIKRLYNSACKILVEYLNLPFAALIKTHSKTKKLLIVSFYADNVESERYFKNIFTSMAEQQIDINNIDGPLDIYSKLNCGIIGNLQSVIALPIYNRNKIIAAFVIGTYERDFFDTDVVSLLKDLNNDLSFAHDKIISDKGKHKLEKALMDLEKRWKSALENSNEGVWLYYINTKKCFYSKKWKEMLGYSEDEIGTGINEFWDRVHPDDRERHKQMINDCLSGKVKHIESTIRLRTKSGAYKWILVRGSIYKKDSKGKTTSIIGTHIDITELKESHENLQQLNRLYEALIMLKFLIRSEENLKNIYKEICKIAVEHSDIAMAGMLEPDINKHTFNKVAYYAKDEQYIKVFKDIKLSTDAKNKFGKGTVGTAFRRKKVDVVDNILTEERFAPWRDVLKSVNLISLVSFPIIYNNEVYAILVLFAKEPSFFNTKLIKLIHYLVNDLAITIGKIKETTTRKEYEKQLSIAYEAFSNINESIIITDNYNRIISVNKSFESLTGYQIPEVVNKTLDIIDAEKHGKEFFKKIQWSLSKVGFWQGEYYIRKKEGDVVATWLSITAVKNTSHEITHFIYVLTDLTQRKEIENKIIYLSNYDALTGLPNRTLFLDRLGQAIASAKRFNKKFAILYIDIDKFKSVNDNLGHDVGDILLQQIAQRLKSIIRGSDTISRSSADEFYIILNFVADIDDTTTVIKKIFDSLTPPFEINEYKISITASIGVSIFPDDGDTPSILMRNAETALYYAKEMGRNTYQFYKTDMTVKSKYAFELKNRLKKALENREFVLYYQPKLSIKTGKITGAEALIRWLHPEKGLIPPLDFIYIAESSGLIKDIGEWVIEEACRQMKEWKSKNLPDISISINISPIQFQDANLKYTIELSLKKASINPSQLELELTESIIMKDTDTSLQTLNTLKAMNLLLSIDDFGTGYSSLAYLKRFPIDKIKIDKSFISHLTEKKTDDASIVKTIISLAKALGLSIVAEGVETKEQLELLKNWGCEEYQGFYFSRPVPAKTFETLLKKNLELPDSECS